MDADRLRRPFDVAIVGGGSAGCVLAARLSEDPARQVLLIEAGPDYGPFDGGRWPASLLDGRVDGAAAADGQPEPHDWGFDGGPAASRARVIGGCSAHNGCELLWGAPADYDDWAVATGDQRWSYASLAPHLRRATETLRTRPTDRTHLSTIRQALVDAAAAIGIPPALDLNAPGSLVATGGIPVNAIGVTRWNAAFAYLDPARERPNLTILPDALVSRVVIGDSRAKTVEIRHPGGAASVEAGLVIVTAGAYATPAILGRSGIGDPAALRRLGIAPVADLPGVGRGLLDHPFVLTRWAATDRLRDADARYLAEDRPLALSEAKWASTRCGHDRWDLTIAAWSGAVRDQRAHPAGGHVAGMAPCVMGAVSRGSVTLRSADPTVLPSIDHGLLTDPDGHDLAVLEEGVALSRDLAATAAWRAWAGEEIDPGPAVSGDTLRSWLRTTASGTYHPCGTARLGRSDDPSAVLEPSGAVRGIARLFVADASIFPTIPAANIHASVLAVAEKIAADLT